MPDGLREVKSMAWSQLDCDFAHLEHGQIQRPSGNNIGYSLGDIGASQPSCLGGVVTELAEKVPQSVLECKSMRVRFRAEVIDDESVVGIVGLFRGAAVQGDSHKLALLSFGKF